MRIVYLDLVSGAAGDMLLGALLDLGADGARVHRSLDGLGLPGWNLRRQDVTRGGIRATKVDVDVDDRATSRTYADVRALVEKAELSEGLRRRALDTFEALARAEATIHGTELEQVHLHEVGAHDAVLDIVGTLAALDTLDAKLVVCSPVPLGSGWTDSGHGELPVPAPATLELVRHMPVTGEGDGELVTPTGAALLGTIVDRFGPIPPMTVSAIGYGAGSRESQRPNVLRALLGEATENQMSAESSVVVEANIDDMAPELVPHAIEMLLAAGASDAWATPIVMKKGRPAIKLSALAVKERLDRVRDTFFRETTTLGLRSYDVDKSELERMWVEVEVEGQPLRVKIGKLGGEAVTVSPEHEEARVVARATGLPLKEVYARASDAARARTR